MSGTWELWFIIIALLKHFRKSPNDWWISLKKNMLTGMRV